MDIACQHTERVLSSRLSSDRRLLVIKSEEGRYFNELFETVIEKIGTNGNDSTTNISIPNIEAAIFLSKSRLSGEVLRQVWNIAKETHEEPDGCETFTTGMNLCDFFTAVKLIQLYQNGYLTDEIDPANNFIEGNVSMEAPVFDGYREISVKYPLTHDKTIERTTHQASVIDGLMETKRDNITHTVIEEPSKQQYERRHSIASGLGSIDSIDQRGETRKAMINNPYVNNERRHSMSSGLGSIDSSGQREKTRMARINDPYYMSSSELGVYGKTFDKYKVVEEKDSLKLRKNGICDGEESEVYWDGSGGYMYITQALKIFLKAKISQQDIGVLWDLVASEANVEKFNRAEFSIVMHLVKCISKKKLSIPGVLPSSLNIWRNSLKKSIEVNSERESFETLIRKAPLSLRDTPSLSTNADEEADALSYSQEISLRIEKVEANINDMQNEIDCISKSNDSSLPLQICSSCESLQGITSSLGSEIVVLKSELTAIKGVEEKNRTEIARVKNHINKMKEKQKISESTVLDLQKNMKHVMLEKGKLEANLDEMQSGMMLMRSVVDKLTDEVSLLHQK